MFPVEQYLQQTSAYINEIFNSNYPNFLLPNLQRSYKWDKDKIEQLWKDLSDYRVVNKLDKSFDYTHNNPDFDKTPPYLLGTIYVIEDTNDRNGKKVRQLIDGQQRLTTISLSVLVWIEMYSSMLQDSKIRNEIEELNQRLDFSCDELRRKVEDILTERKTPKLIYPQSVNNDFWEGLCKCTNSDQFIEQLNKADTNIETQKNIVNAFNCLRKCMAAAIDDFPDDNTRTISWKKIKNKYQWDLSKIRQMLASDMGVAKFENFMTRFSGLAASLLYCVCLVQFKCTATQQVSLFDIINNRGEPFDMPDMVRLMLFSCVKQSKHEDLNKIWTRSKINESILPCVWNAFYAKSEKDLARKKLELQIDNLLSSGLSESQKEAWVMDFAKRCSASASRLNTDETFNDVLLSDESFAKVAFITSNDFMKFTHPVYFALEDASINNVLRNSIYTYLLNFVTRVAIVKEKDSKTISKILPRLAISVCIEIRNFAEKNKNSTNAENLKTNCLLENIKEIITKSEISALVTDEEFKEKFKKFVLPKNMTRFGYMVIASLEFDLVGPRSACTLKYYGKAQEQNNNLEHIYPQNPDKNNWPDYSKEYELYIGKIGNLLPISTTMNSACGNKAIKEKVVDYEQSGLLMWPELKEMINKEIGSSKAGTWTKEKIDKRTADLAVRAVEVFSLN